MSGHARLTLRQDMRQFGDAEFALGAERENPQPRRFRGGPESCERLVHDSGGPFDAPSRFRTEPSVDPHIVDSMTVTAESAGFLGSRKRGWAHTESTRTTNT